MTTTHEVAEAWSKARDDRQTAVRNHRLYPLLFRKVAQYAADSHYATRPISHHYRASVGRDTFLGSDGQFWYRRWQQTIIRHDRRSYPQAQSLGKAMQAVAELIEPDIFTDEERDRHIGGHSDRLAAIWCTALDDIRMRVDGRRR